MRGLALLGACLAGVVALAAGAGAANGNASYHAVCPGSPFDTARCHAQVVTDARGNPLATTAPTGYGPVQFQTAYALPSSTAGWGQTIAIVDAFDDPNAEADLATYSSTYGLPSCTTANGCFRKVDQTGGTRYPRADQGWALEISLDVQVAHAVCPNCKILLVEAKTNSFSNLIAAEDYATAHADVVSNSWGGGEFSSETGSGYDGHFNHPGVPITVSSGDSGYGVGYPAASPYVTAVGGTRLTLNSNDTRSSETAWSGAGSGCSAYEAVRRGVRPAERGRRIRRRRPEHRCVGVRLGRLPGPERLVQGRGDEPLGAARCRRLRPGGERRLDQRRLVPVHARRVPLRRHVGEQRQLRRKLPLQRRPRLRRPIGPRCPERDGGVLATQVLRPGLRWAQPDRCEDIPDRPASRILDCVDR
jgi:Subtilase family